MCPRSPPPSVIKVLSSPLRINTPSEMPAGVVLPRKRGCCGGCKGAECFFYVIERQPSSPTSSHPRTSEHKHTQDAQSHSRVNARMPYCISETSSPTFSHPFSSTWPVTRFSRDLRCTLHISFFVVVFFFSRLSLESAFEAVP